MLQEALREALREAMERARQIRRSERFKYALATFSRLALHARQRLNPGVFAIDIHENSGFFSVLQMVLFILMYCEEKGLVPRISAHGPIYGDPDGRIDWFSTFFETVRPPPDAAPARKVRTSRVHDLVQLGLRGRYEARLELKSASALFQAHYRPAAFIRDEVDALCATLGIGETTLGVHFRGTDKRHEAESMSWEAFCQVVASTLAENPRLTSLFVSSDEAAFLDFFAAWPFGKPVRVAPSKLLADGSMPIHFRGYAGLEIGREALVSSLLLSRCGFLVKTPSYLSAWSKIFNPALPVRLASPPRPDAFWFPDSQLWAENDMAPAA
ncbi:hypothetical protein [Cupriavidus basilensis]|uniref:hypothetical protein n=1 Tax=Cupriavidus basilensis TaxID=68895 RepID=UPI000750B78E|nr:hypothetical protein [Cupriavidus basilensis]